MTVKELIKTLSSIDETLTVDSTVNRDLSHRGLDILDMNIRIIKGIKDDDCTY